MGERETEIVKMRIWEKERTECGAWVRPTLTGSDCKCGSECANVKGEKREKAPREGEEREEA